MLPLNCSTLLPGTLILAEMLVAYDVLLNVATVPYPFIIRPVSFIRLLDSVAYAVTHKLGNIISLSWGEAESQLTTPTLSDLNSIYKQAAENNITVVGASGDSGADDGTSHLSVNFPASDPYVLGIGGTTLRQTTNGFTQTAWGDMVSGKVEASGGGFSSYFSTPYYQAAPNYTGTQRGVPDVSLDANPNTGALVIVGGQKSTLGGTSIATPMWAGIGYGIKQPGPTTR